MNPDYENTHVFVNDYSAVKEGYTIPAGEEGKEMTGGEGVGLLKAEIVTGRCLVICFNPAHNLYAPSPAFPPPN